MENSENEKQSGFQGKLKSGLAKTGAVFGKIGRVLSVIGSYIYKLRKILMALPVGYAALRLATYCQKNLPEMVGIDLQANGEYAKMISRDVAVMGPLAVTAACLLLMFCSRRTVYPWIISIFSLILPVLILVTNQFPA